ncbi:hypothetical protein F5J12DRAFT_864269 [Pisolithus orientalis]|uniref:uncharacterized protein n=1 Tax=Pisolithus orientalis TaxID=936130 RepID=UPI0022245262|nr:uncharacterized protein F5J12DRAFT_864269 [Pisolithus orientalis]KAI5989659.1 hypothetical protein F5J12DRAFT_864269 [Pisolithus orientalis]
MAMRIACDTTHHTFGQPTTHSHIDLRSPGHEIMPRFHPQSIGESISKHTFRQLKFIIPGAIITYAFDTHHVVLDLSTHSEPSNMARLSALLSLALGSFVIGLFLYVLFVPWIQGIELNYRLWRQSPVLSSVIPVLTASILAGWSLLSITLGKWSKLGYIEGVIGASGLYALTFGLIGLLPAPKIHRA